VQETKCIVEDPIPFDTLPVVHDRLPTEVAAARPTGVMARFSPESYEGDTREYPRRVGVFQYSPEEVDRIKSFE
jgi:hypothetical protein